MNTEDYKGILLKPLKCFLFNNYISQLLPYYSAKTTLKKNSGLEKRLCLAYFLCELWIGCSFAPIIFIPRLWLRPCLARAWGHLILMAETEQELLEIYGVS